ncbi:MAG: alpha/beta fold hydrolase, partial [Ruminococcus sp.]|nr:alpha/beta fold hydrolase [Ruminococcus sp.]
MKTTLCAVQSAYIIKVKRYEPEKQASSYILALHGFCGDMESSYIRKLGKLCTKQGIAVVAFNFPGHGTSDADDYFSLENCRKDMLAVIRYANSLYGVSSPAAICGTSFGGYITLLNLPKIPLSTDIVLRAPAVNMKRSFEKFLTDMYSFKKRGFEEMGFERKILVPYTFYTELENNNILEHNFDRDMLIVHGDHDDIVLPEDMQRFCIHNPGVKLRVVSGGDHRFK